MRALPRDAETRAAAPDLKPRGVSLAAHHDTGVVAAGRAGQRRVKQALDDADVAGIDRGRFDRDQDLARTRNREVAFDTRKHRRRPVSVKSQCGHLVRHHASIPITVRPLLGSRLKIKRSRGKDQPPAAAMTSFT